MQSTLHSYEEVLQAVKRWPADQRALLAHALIDSLERRPRSAPKEQDVSDSSLGTSVADRAYGLLADQSPAPSDAEVERILEQRRMEKYGR